MLGVLGDLVEDIVVWLGEPLRYATDTKVTVHRRRGGSAANVAAFAAAHFPTRFLGCVGSDRAGAALVDELRSHGVEVVVQRRGTTGTVVVLVDDESERTMLPDRGAAVSLTEVPESGTRGLTHLHVPAYSFDGAPTSTTATDLVHRMHRQGATVSVDASSTGVLHRYGPERFRHLLGTLRPEFLLANRAEAEVLGLLTDSTAESALPDEMGDTVVVVKDGAAATTILRRGVPALRVPVPALDGVRDATGAGDAFAAGFLTATLRGADPADACVTAHAHAARVLRSPGATMSNAVIE